MLLPIQAMATVSLCRHAQAAAAGAAATEHCLLMQADVVENAQSDNNNQSQPADQNQHSCCAASAACAMCFVTINTSQTTTPASVRYQSNVFVPPQYTSFVPDGLQRPPSLLA